MLAPLNVRLDEKLVARVKAHSESTGVPQARIVRDALTVYLESRGLWEQRAVEKAHEGLQEGESFTPEAEEFLASVEAPVQEYKCPRGCERDWRAKSPTAPCPRCNRRNLIPA